MLCLFKRKFKGKKNDECKVYDGQSPLFISYGLNMPTGPLIID